MDLLIRILRRQLILVLLLVMGLWFLFSGLPAQAAINDQIHFQGKVVNTNGTNVANGDYSFIFTIYDASTAGTNLWTETKTITVTDGIFATDLGSVTDMPASINFNSETLYLGVNFNSDGEMDPRIRLTAVPYAFNAEKVAGLTVTETTGTLTIPNATTIAFSGANNVTFTSSSATNVTLPTTGTLATLAGTEIFSNKTIASGGLTVENTAWIGLGTGDGKVTFTNTGTDTIAFENAYVGIGTSSPNSRLDVAGYIKAPGATLSATYAGGTALTLNAGPTATADIMSWQNSAGSVLGIINSAGNLGIGTSTASNFALEIAGSIGPEANNTRVLGSDTKRWSSIHTTQVCLSGDCQTAWPSGSGGSNWRYNLGSISVVNDTVDLLVGANSTASAKFAVLNINNGTPVASISSGLDGNSMFMTADGTLATQRRQGLIIGNSSTYNTSGNILLHPNGTGNVGIGTTAAVVKLDVRGGDIASIGSNSTLALGDALTAGNYGYLTWNTTSDYISLGTQAGGPTLNINESGYLGIGTTAPGTALDVAGYIKAPGATLSATYAGGTALTLNAGPTATADIMSWQNSAGSVLGVINSAGNFGIGTSTASNFALEIAGSIGPEANNTRSLGSDTKRWTNIHTSQLCLAGDCKTAWPVGGSGTTNWRYNLGTLSPLNDTVDLLVGANATASAKFAVLNVNNGTPVASISSGLDGNSMFITADGTLSTTRRQGLIIGNSSTYNTTGNVLINPNGTGNVSIGTTNFASFKLNIDAAHTGPIQGAIYGVNRFQGSSAAGFINGISVLIQNEGTGAIDSSSGLEVIISNSATGGTMNNVYGLKTQANIVEDGTITNFYHSYLGAVDVGAGSVTNVYGLYVENQNVGVTSSYNIYSAGSTSKNYFEGNIGIGTASPNSKLDVAGYIKAPGATLSATYAGGTALTLNAGPTATADIMQWQNSAGSVLGVINSAGNLGIGTSTASNFALEIAGSIGPEANNTRSLGSDTKRWTNIHTSQICLTGDCKTAWPTGGGSNEWRYNLGTISVVNDTVDMLVGSNATASAKFAVLNVNSGTPIASISSGVSGNSMFMSADGTLSTTRRQNLTLGNSSTYDTTGDVLIHPNGTGNVGIGTTAVDSQFEVVSGDTTRALQVIGDSVTTGEVIDISADGLTTGYAFNMSSTSNNLTTGGLVDLDWTPTAVATASGDLFRISLGAHADITGNLFALYDSGSNIFLASTVKITSGVPHEFTASGDVSMAYDLILTNQTASEIQSYGPLTIKSGEAYENLDLTLDPSGTGAVVVADSSDLELYADQKLILDTDDGGNSYIHFDNTNNRVEIFADGSERVRFTASGSNETNGAFATTLSDLAENYPTMNDALAPGDVVMVVEQGENAPAAGVVDLADAANKQNVLGVVSSKPGIILGGSSFLSDICEASAASASGKVSQRIKLLQTEFTQMKLQEFENIVQSASTSATVETIQETISTELVSMDDDELETTLPATTVKTIDDRLSSCEAVKQVPIALAGRVPVKFDNSQGSAKAGDLLAVSPNKAGYVVKAKTAGWVIGRALAASTSDSETVMMFVNITWYGGGDSIASLGQVLGTSDVSLSPDLNELLSTSTINGKQFIVSSTNMSVFGTMTAETLAATDKILTGMLSIGGTNNEITTVNGSALKLQSGFGAGNIEAFNKKLVFTSEGGVIAEDQITAKRFAGSEESRGSIYATGNRIRIDKQWKSAPASITLTPEYRADVWVSDITKDGFYINAEPLSANKKIYWWAVW